MVMDQEFETSGRNPKLKSSFKLMRLFVKIRMPTMMSMAPLR
jgi:hypothetical protein